MKSVSRCTKVARGLIAAVAVALTGCGAAPEAPPATPVNPALAIDSDVLALLPPGPAAMASVDTRAFYASGSTGGQLAAMTEGVLPLGQEVGFSASRDVDRMVVGVYVSGGVDAVAVLSGRFDAARMQAAVSSHAATRGGVPWLSAPYAGRTLYSAASFGFAPLTDHTLAAGSESAVRRLLDRLAQSAAPGAKPRARDLPDWMVKTLETPGSSFATAADVGSLPPMILQSWPIPGTIAGLSRVAVVGDFHPPGLNVAGTLAYPDPARATGVADSLRQLGALVAVAGQYGAAPRLQNLNIAAEGPSVAFKFVLDDEAIRRSLASVMKLFAGATARPG